MGVGSSASQAAFRQRCLPGYWRGAPVRREGSCSSTRRSSTTCTWMQDHGIEQQRRVNEGLIRLHTETGIPLVAANDSHYTTRNDARMHDVLLCIGTGKFYNDPNRMKFSGQEFYVKTIDEMARIFPDHPEALE